MRYFNIKIISLFAAVLFPITVTYANIGSTSPTPAFRAVSNPEHPFPNRKALGTPASVWGEVKKPYPTTAWFGNFALRGGTAEYPDAEIGLQPMFPTPYTLKNTPHGLAFGVPEASLAKNEQGKVYAQIYGFNPQMQFAVNEPEEFKRSIQNVTDLSANLHYKIDDQHYMYFPVVRGAPYVTAFYHNLTPVLIPGAGVHSVNGQPPANPITGSRFEIVLGLDAENKQTWIIYSEKPLTLTWKTTAQGWQLVTQAPYTGWLRATLLSDTRAKIQNDEALLDEYAKTIPISGDVQLADADTFVFQWKTENGRAPLMMALPHHRNTFNTETTAALTPKISFRVTQGEMQAVAGKSKWVMDVTLPKISFLELSDQEVSKLPAERRQAIIDALKTDSSTVSATATPDGPYGSGKRFARAARLAVIAHQFSKFDKDLSTVESNILDELTQNLTSWVKGENKFILPGNKAVNNSLVYDTTWGGIIPTVDDYGSQIYNDHHFHYGYFVYTYAVLTELAKHNMKVALWLKTPVTTIAGGSITPAEWIKFLIRDYANPNQNDAYFPYARHIDFFNGHSYASGLDAAADGRNQESTSEAVNAYYALALLGEAQGSKELAQWGKLLKAQEINAARLYWQVTKSSDIYQAAYKHANSIATIVFDGKVDAHTFFGANKEFVYGIQMMPFTGASLLLLANPWIEEIYETISSIKLPDTDAWKWILLKGRLLGAPSGEVVNSIWQEAVQSPNGNYDNGDSKANTLYLIAKKMQLKK